jgi:hypothetical protein
MATAAVISTMPSSFIYEDLILKVQSIQKQMIEIENVLNNRWKNEEKIQNELKSRSLTFIDPHGNRMSVKFMDHELISKVIRKYKKDYIPKYLQQRIQIGIMNDNIILPLTDSDLKSTVSDYANGKEFITYADITIWIGYSTHLWNLGITQRVRMTDKMEKIQIQINKHRQFDRIELKSCIINENTGPTEEEWNRGKILTLEDTIMSAQLYQDKCAVVAKIIREKVNYSFLYFLQSHIILFF